MRVVHRDRRPDQALPALLPDLAGSDAAKGMTMPVPDLAEVLAERRRGVIAASTGNHGQSVAYAADLFGVRAVICMPEQANPVKVESMRALGAEVVFYGRDFDEAREHCEKQATRTAFELPQQIMRDLLDDFVLVSEDALKAATRLMIEKTRNLVEPAGAAALAAVLGTPGRFAGRRVAIVCSGGNISPAQLVKLWPSEPA